MTQIILPDDYALVAIPNHVKRAMKHEALRLAREQYELAYNWCRAMHQYGTYGPANDGIAIMKRIPAHIRRAAARSYNARRYQRFEWVAGSWRPNWVPF